MVKRKKEAKKQEDSTYEDDPTTPRSVDREGYKVPYFATAEAYKNGDYILMPHEWPFMLQTHRKSANLNINSPQVEGPQGDLEDP